MPDLQIWLLVTVLMTGETVVKPVPELMCQEMTRNLAIGQTVSAVLNDGRVVSIVAATCLRMTTCDQCLGGR